MTHIINGREIAQNLRNNIKKEISELKNKFGSVPASCYSSWKYSCK